jgi:hypothetical protein
MADYTTLLGCSMLGVECWLFPSVEIQSAPTNVGGDDNLKTARSRFQNSFGCCSGALRAPFFASLTFRRSQTAATVNFEASTIQIAAAVRRMISSRDVCGLKPVMRSNLLTSGLRRRMSSKPGA